MSPLSLLILLLEGIIKAIDAGVKGSSIGQSIMQAARPHVLLAPLQIGLAVQLHHHFSSRFLIKSLHKHGFYSSYKETAIYEQNAAVNQGTTIPSHESQFVQYAAENVDHNIRKLDGHNTFNGRGIIAMVTPRINQEYTVPRTHVKCGDVSSAGLIKIHYYREDNRALAKLM